jgi:DNA polymerase-3 subunit epsilon
MSDQSSKKIIDDLSFCVIDLETTGGNHSKDKIIEVGMVKIKARKIVAEKSFLVNPEIHIPEFIQKLTNISPKDVESEALIEDLTGSHLRIKSSAPTS